jgi:hypothetical protein
MPPHLSTRGYVLPIKGQRSAQEKAVKSNDQPADASRQAAAKETPRARLQNAT